MLWTVLILALAGADVSVPADFEDCRAEALSEMAAVGIFEDQVRGVVSYPREDDSYDGMIVGYDVSVHLYTCSDRVYINPIAIAVRELFMPSEIVKSDPDPLLR